MVTSSVYSMPVTSEPSPYISAKGSRRPCEVELIDGSYSLCPEQDDPQRLEGTKRSLLPVSNCTADDTGQTAIIN